MADVTAPAAVSQQNQMPKIILPLSGRRRYPHQSRKPYPSEHPINFHTALVSNDTPRTRRRTSLAEATLAPGTGRRAGNAQSNACNAAETRVSGTSSAVSGRKGALLRFCCTRQAAHSEYGLGRSFRPSRKRSVPRYVRRADGAVYGSPANLWHLISRRPRLRWEKRATPRRSRAPIGAVRKFDVVSAKKITHSCFVLFFGGLLESLR